eukprot:scaffold3016_cov29-Attheya_sp.AAC.1
MRANLRDRPRWRLQLSASGTTYVWLVTSASSTTKSIIVIFNNDHFDFFAHRHYHIAALVLDALVLDALVLDARAALAALGLAALGRAAAAAAAAALANLDRC